MQKKEPISEYLGDVVLTPELKSYQITQLNPTEFWLFYFSASWCGPCHQVTDLLRTLYLTLQTKSLEVILIPKDYKENDWMHYFASMPWLSLPFSDKPRIKMLTEMCQVETIPTLVVVDKHGQILNYDAVPFLKQDPKGRRFPWRQT